MRVHAGLLLLLALPLAAEAGDRPYEPRAMTLVPGQRLSVVHRDGSVLAGRLIACDPSLRLLHLAALEDSSQRQAIPFARIHEVQYRTGGSVKWGSTLGGFAGGAVAGGIIGRILHKPEGSFDFGGPGIGMAVGSTVGLVAGFVLPLVLPSTRHVPFDERAEGT